METIYYAFVGLAFFMAIANWRAGLYACVLFDGLRDPIRKLSADQPVAITAVVAVIWFGALIGVLNAHRAELLNALRLQYPKVRKGIQCMAVALIPGAAISLALYYSGYRLVVIGGVSYLTPIIGLAVGFVFPRTERDVQRLFAFYTVLNSILMIGAALEYRGSDMLGLGGMSMDWVRHMPGIQVNLIAGFYRSPDVLGLHAAHVAVFSAILAVRAKGPGRFGWSALATWGGMCLLLAGRRKMIAFPFIFVAAYFLLALWRGSRVSRGARVMVGLAAFITAVTLNLMHEAEVSSEYTVYASTLVTEGSVRSREIVAGSVFTTLEQSGLLGDGLGSATQGSQYANVQSTRRGWQEDGASRLFKELGLFGVLFMGMAAILFTQSLVTAIKNVPAGHPVADLQVCLISLVVANMSCFIASHQVYSGDPATSLFVVFLLGVVFGVPRVLQNEQARVAHEEWRGTKFEIRNCKLETGSIGQPTSATGETRIEHGSV